MTDTAMNTVSDERLAHYIEYADLVGDNGTPAISTGELAAMARELQSLRASIPGGVGVKGLEWPDTIRRGHRVASGRGLIQYTICHYGGSEPDSGVVYRWAAAGEGWHGPLFSYDDAIAAAQDDYERRILSALELLPAEGETSDGSEQAAIEIADAVIAWMVRHDLLDADQEYRDDDIIAVLDELSPGLATTNDEAFASPLVAPPNPVISDEVVERACKIQHVGWSLWHEPQKNTAREVMRSALTAALSVKPQSGENG